MARCRVVEWLTFPINQSITLKMRKFSQVGIVFITIGFQIDFSPGFRFPVGNIRVYFSPLTFFSVMSEAQIILGHLQF